MGKVTQISKQALRVARRTGPYGRWSGIPVETMEAKCEYIRELQASDGDILDAMFFAAIDYKDLSIFRRDRFFAAIEQACFGKADPLRYMKQNFLVAYEQHFLNMTKACRDTRVERETIDEWKNDDPDFATRMKQAELAIHDEVVETAVRGAVGKASHRVDSAHLRWLLGKIDPRFADQKQLPNGIGGATELPDTSEIDAELVEFGNK